MACGCGCEPDINYTGHYGFSRAWSPATEANPQTGTLTAGDVISNVLEFPCTVLGEGKTGVIDEIAIYETRTAGALAKNELDLYLFHTSPSIPAKGNAFAAPTDPTEIIQRIRITAADWHEIDASNALAILRNLGANIYSSANEADAKKIYGVFVTVDTSQYDETAKITAQLRIIRD